MGLGTSTTVLRSSSHTSASCQLVVRTQGGHDRLMEFIVAGLEAGQQVWALGAAEFLKQVAQQLSDGAHRPEALLHNERLVFLTAPECFLAFDRRDNPFHRVPLHRNGSLLRWVSDWSWLKAHEVHFQKALCYQRRIHEFGRSLGALSLCTADSARIERSSLLAMMADHRRALKPNARPC